MLKYALIVGMLVGCGSKPIDDFVLRTDYVDHRTPHIEYELQPHVAKFEEISGHNVSILMEWAELDDSVMGVCYSWSDGHREIQIDSVKWVNLTYEGQEELVMHELGHCILNLEHDEGVLDMGGWTNLPRSIMYPYVFGDYPFYKEFQQYYHDQLVGK